MLEVSRTGAHVKPTLSLRYASEAICSDGESFDHSKSLICCKDTVDIMKRGSMTKLSSFSVMGQKRHFGLLQSAD
jgi:hypothetical protein